MKSIIERKDQENHKLLQEKEQFKIKFKENDDNLNILIKLYESEIINEKGVNNKQR